MPWNAADGSINVTVVSGSTRTGVMAADGSLNIIKSAGTSPVGAYHPCGAMYVSLPGAATKSIKAADGSMNVSKSGAYFSGTQRVTVVSGVLS